MKLRLIASFMYALLVAGILSLFTVPAFAEIYIISNKSVVNKTLSHDEIRDIFLGKQKRWSDNSVIEIVIMESSSLHRDFVETYTAKTTAQFRNWWRKRLFTGKGIIPKSFAHEKELLEYVSKTGGAVGYVSLKIPADSNLHVLPVTE